jgi:putative membrane protein
MMRETRPLAVVLVVLVGLVLLSATTVGGMMGGAMGPGMMWGNGGQVGAPVIGGWGSAIAMGVGWLMMLAFWAALIVGVVLLVRWAGGAAPGQAAHEDPLAILQRRYAAGEIDEETYRRMRRDIEQPASSGEARGGIRRAS